MAQEKRKIPIVNNEVRRDGHSAAGPAAPAPDAPAAPDAPEGTSESAPDPAETADQMVVEVEEDTAPLAGDAVVDAPSPLQTAIVERDAYLDSLMRLQAEFDNYRRRSQKESTEARSRARGSLLTEFLPVFDNLARALDAAEHHEEGKVLEGVRLTHNLFAGLLSKEGVSEIPALDAHFDPHLHEAVITVPSEAEEGVVVQVVEKGYTFDDKVLRPARVVVSAGPVAASSGEEA